jgi:hypothetical protein
MHDPQKEKPVRQREMPKKDEPVQPQPANDRPVGGQGVVKDERAQTSRPTSNVHGGISSTTTPRTGWGLVMWTLTYSQPSGSPVGRPGTRWRVPRPV